MSRKKSDACLRAQLLDISCQAEIMFTRLTLCSEQVFKMFTMFGAVRLGSALAVARHPLQLTLTDAAGETFSITRFFHTFSKDISRFSAVPRTQTSGLSSRNLFTPLSFPPGVNPRPPGGGGGEVGSDPPPYTFRYCNTVLCYTDFSDPM